jgi:hypothetical protein
MIQEINTDVAVKLSELLHKYRVQGDRSATYIGYTISRDIVKDLEDLKSLLVKDKR